MSSFTIKFWLIGFFYMQTLGDMINFVSGMDLSLQVILTKKINGKYR